MEALQRYINKSDHGLGMPTDSSSHRPGGQDTAAFYNYIRQNKISNEDEKSPFEVADSVSQEEMYKVYDTEEGRYMDIRDLEKDIYVTD